MFHDLVDRPLAFVANRFDPIGTIHGAPNMPQKRPWNRFNIASHFFGSIAFCLYSIVYAATTPHLGNFACVLHVLASICYCLLFAASASYHMTHACLFTNAIALLFDQSLVLFSLGTSFLADFSLALVVDIQCTARVIPWQSLADVIIVVVLGIGTLIYARLIQPVETTHVLIGNRYNERDTRFFGHRETVYTTQLAIALIACAFAWLPMAPYLIAVLGPSFGCALVISHASASLLCLIACVNDRKEYSDVLIGKLKIECYVPQAHNILHLTGLLVVTVFTTIRHIALDTFVVNCR